MSLTDRQVEIIERLIDAGRALEYLDPDEWHTEHAREARERFQRARERAREMLLDDRAGLLPLPIVEGTAYR